MLLIPAIDLKDGHCVRLKQGDMDQSTVFSEDPAAMARNWVNKGARRLHLVDLNGAFAGKPKNEAAIKKILAEVGSEVDVQLGGGIRDLDTIERYLDAGLRYVIIGTAAVKNPGFLQDASGIMKSLGQGKRIDELLLSINRAAEAAVPMGKDLLVSAVRGMSVTDAKGILTGGSTSVTNFFAEKTRAPLSGTFLPIVTKATEKVGLANKYNDIAGKASGFGLVKKEDANIQQYVTGKSLDGLYLIIGEEEKKIRQDPVGTGSDILKKVFGALK